MKFCSYAACNKVGGSLPQLSPILTTTKTKSLNNHDSLYSHSYNFTKTQSIANSINTLINNDIMNKFATEVCCLVPSSSGDCTLLLAVEILF